MTIKLVQNDTLPVLNATIMKDGCLVDLSAATVKFYMINADTDAVKIDGKNCDIIDAKKGKVRYSWEAEDTDTVGTYLGEFEVTFTTGKIQTGFKQLTIIIRDDI